jgi:prepilin-type N-terminal cleavage/methylation domain-containing protein
MRASAARRAFSLVEVVVVLTMLGVVGGAIGMLLVRQQRFYRGVGEMLNAREGVRDAVAVLAGDIRGLAAADTVRLLTDSAIEMFSSIGTSAVCQVTDDTHVGLPSATSEGALTSLLTQPDTGDLAFFYTATAPDSARWERHRIAGFSGSALASNCPASSAFSTPGDGTAGAQGFQLTLQSPVSANVRPGAPVRFVRRGRYSLYRAADAEWYLGYRRCNALGSSTCGAVQPLSGPYLRYSTDRNATGLLFEYFDTQGNRLGPGSSPLGLARVDVTARAQSRQQLLIEGRQWVPGDSATISIAIRNRFP